MYKPIEPEQSKEPDDQLESPETDAPPPTDDESRRLPLPGELHEPPPVTREKREQDNRDPQDDLMDS